MKNECGHPVASEESVLRCCDCESARRKREDDACWNAAIEAAATRVDVEAQESHTREIAAVLDDVAARIRAHKREAK